MESLLSANQSSYMTVSIRITFVVTLIFYREVAVAGKFHLHQEKVGFFPRIRLTEQVVQ